MMGIHPLEVSACLVTRGDQPDMMKKIQDSLLPYGEVIVWDNSVRTDYKCAGRYAAAEEATHDVVYFQDDDVIVPVQTQLRLMQNYEPGVVTAVWGHGTDPDGYTDLPLVCGGAVMDANLPRQAITRWCDGGGQLDDDFNYEADFVVGVLYPEFKHLHLPFDIDLSIAQAPERLCNQPWQRDLKRNLTSWARAIRDEG